MISRLFGARHGRRRAQYHSSMRAERNEMFGQVAFWTTRIVRSVLLGWLALNVLVFWIGYYSTTHARVPDSWPQWLLWPLRLMVEQWK